MANKTYETLNIIYKNKNTGNTYVRFEVNPNEKEVELFCSQDNTGNSDLHRFPVDNLKTDFEEIERFTEVEEYEEDEEEDGQ